MTVSLKERRWDLMEVGEELGPISVAVDDHKIKAFAYAVDDYDPAYMVRRPTGDRIGHPALLCNDLFHVRKSKYDYNTGEAGLHAKQEYEFLNSVRLGQTITLTGRFVDKYIRREKTYIVFEAEGTDEDGRLVNRGRSTIMMGLRPGVMKEPAPAPAPEAKAEAPAATIVGGPVLGRASKDTPIGAQVKPMVKFINAGQVVIFTGTDRRSIHTDLQTARAAGLPDIIAQGLMSMTYISEALNDFFGKTWQQGGKISVTFIAPVYPGDVITSSAVVREKVAEGRRQRLMLDVWSENASGRRVTVGNASALV